MRTWVLLLFCVVVIAAVANAQKKVNNEGKEDRVKGKGEVEGKEEKKSGKRNGNRNPNKLEKQNESGRNVNNNDGKNGKGPRKPKDNIIKKKSGQDPKKDRSKNRRRGPNDRNKSLKKKVEKSGNQLSKKEGNQLKKKLRQECPGKCVDPDDCKARRKRGTTCDDDQVCCLKKLARAGKDGTTVKRFCKPLTMCSNMKGECRKKKKGCNLDEKRYKNKKSKKYCDKNSCYCCVKQCKSKGKCMKLGGSCMLKKTAKKLCDGDFIMGKKYCKGKKCGCCVPGGQPCKQKKTCTKEGGSCVPLGSSCSGEIKTVNSKGKAYCKGSCGCCLPDKVTTKPKTTVNKVTTKPKTTADKVTTKPKTTADKVTTKPKTTADKVTTKPKTTVDKVTTKPKTTAGKVTTKPNTTADKETTKPKTTADKVTTKPKTTADKVTTKPKTTQGKVTTKPTITPDKVTTKPATTQGKVTTKPITTPDKVTPKPTTTPGKVTTKPKTTPITTVELITTEKLTSKLSTTTKKISSPQPDATSTTVKQDATSPVAPTTVELNTTTSTGTTASSCNVTRVYCTDCGIANISVPDSRIVNGSDASPNEYPYQVRLLLNFTNNFYSCGGSIIKRKWILTAAHCILNKGSLADTIEIQYGDRDVNQAKKVMASSYVPHENYDNITLANDIAVIELTADFDFSDPSVQSICIAEEIDIPFGGKAIATGWGRLSTDGEAPDILQEVAVDIINNTLCEDLFVLPPEGEKAVCAFTPYKGICFGDSGGPLAAKLCNDRWVVFGISSYVSSLGCATGTKPSVFTRVPPYRSWIDEKTGSASC